uniref:Uncharacterized protein n=1 Tax=Meloidogyne enterolobii TaxID=390850 RepID=A0A6V7YAV6_MELEN|nr:unnamed protein product [Meloidogyne enterolobii]
MDKHRFELKLHVRKNSADTDFSGYILHSKITEKYDYCKFDKHELSTDDKTPIAFQKNIYTLEVLFNKQILTGPIQIDAGIDKAILIPLNSSKKYKVFNSPHCGDFADFARPTRVLKFIANKIHPNLKMKLLCVTTHVVYDLMEHSDYYSTLYYNRRVCQDDKYLLNIEENEYNIVG